MGNKEEIIVYWSLYNGVSEHKFDKQLMDLEPVPVFSNLIKRRSSEFQVPLVPNIETNGYQTCTALHTVSNNMYMIKSPFDTEIKFKNDWTIDRDSILSFFFTERISSLDNSIAFDFNISHLFFSEEELEIEVLPPFMHKPEQSKYGFPAMASFDISGWFRPVILTYHLWENVKSFNVKMNDPLIYIRFKTDKKIVFKRFVQTKEIQELAQTCMNYKKVEAFKSLPELYERFKRTKTNQAILNEIKKNLV